MVSILRPGQEGFLPTRSPREELLEREDFGLWRAFRPTLFRELQEEF